MTINAYSIAVTAELTDNVSNRLMAIAEWADKANSAMLAFAESARKASAAGIGMARNFEKAATAATALGDSAGGLTRASYVIDTMAASSADLARNMAAARTEANGMRTPGRVPGGGGGGPGSGASGAAAAAETSGGGRASTAAGVAAAGMLVGVAENARLQHTNLIASATEQLPYDDWLSNANTLRDLEFKYARQYAVATGGKISPFGEAILESSRLMRTLKPADQKNLLDAAMPFAAYEATFKEVPLPEALQAFVGLAHQAGAYSPQAASSLFEAMAQASLTTHASLGQIGRAASYALPSLHAAGANSSDVMLLIATMMQGGIMNTKSGTWLNAMAANALPNTLGSGLFSNKKQNEALHDLGLYKGNQSQFYKNGSMDLMKEVAILAADRQSMEPLKFNALLKQAFGTQGARGASFFSEESTLANLQALSALSKNGQAPVDIMGQLNRASTIAQADQTIASANMALMNGTLTLTGPVNAVLSGANSVFSWTADVSKEHPVLGSGLVGGELFAGALAGMEAWKGSKWAFGMAEKGIGNLTKFLASGAGTLLARAATAITGEEIGAATLAAVGGEIAVAAAIVGGIAYLIQRGYNSVTSKMTPDQQLTFYQGIAGGGPAFGGDNVTKSAPAQQHDTHVTVKLDSHDIAAHVEKKLVPAKTTGPTGFNGDATVYTPGMGVYP
jgi:hypothetical protein